MEKIKKISTYRDSGSIEVETTENMYIFQISSKFLQNKNNVPLFEDIYIAPNFYEGKFHKQRITLQEKENLKLLLVSYVADSIFSEFEQQEQIKIRNRCVEFLNSDLKNAECSLEITKSIAQNNFMNKLLEGDI